MAIPQTTDDKEPPAAILLRQDDARPQSGIRGTDGWCLGSQCWTSQACVRRPLSQAVSE